MRRNGWQARSLKRRILLYLIRRLQRPLESYQPLYGVDLPGRRSGRKCQDRWAWIQEALDQEGGAGVGGLVIDIGSSFGYFVMAAARAGYQAVGVDTTYRLYLIQRFLAMYLGISDRVRIVKGEARPGFVGELLATRPFGRRRARAVLLLSVVQHMIYAYGEEQARAILREVSQHSEVVFLELPNAEEKHYWASRYPSDPSVLLNGIFSRGYRLLGYTADLHRPLYMGMNGE